jgi:hypothetical protein
MRKIKSIKNAENAEHDKFVKTMYMPPAQDAGMM